MERDWAHNKAHYVNKISTHTLTWSVTDIAVFLGIFTNISTHTLTWSVTARGAEKGPNSRISTHTLTWSVT